MHESEPIKGLKEREICPVEGCEGDARYYPPGKGHRTGCYYPHKSQDAKDAFEALVQDDILGSVELEAQPSTESKIIISLLMRIYDVQMALLSNVDKATADKLYDAHERGEDFNPTIYIPEIGEDE